jgi:hypothetical protein
MVNWRVGVKFSGIVLLQYKDCLEDSRLGEVYPRLTIGKLLCLYRQNVPISQSVHRIRIGR